MTRVYFECSHCETNCTVYMDESEEGDIILPMNCVYNWDNHTDVTWNRVQKDEDKIIDSIHKDLDKIQDSIDKLRN